MCKGQPRIRSTLTSFNSQLYADQSHLRRQSQLRDCPDGTALWTGMSVGDCLNYYLILEGLATVGNTIPWTGGLQLYKKAN